MSLAEIVLLLLVGIVVVGPRNLPTMMRTAGQWVARLRRMSTELRSQSGIDDLLRREGLDEHLHQLRSLTRLNMVESFIAPAATPAASPGATPDYTPPAYPPGDGPERPPPPEPLDAPPRAWKRLDPVREREYPLIGCDAHGALADDAVVPAVDTAPPMFTAADLKPLARKPEDAPAAPPAKEVPT